MIDTALIKAPTRGAESIYGRTLLERAITNCQRVGMRRVFVERSTTTRDDLMAALGRFRETPEITIVDSLAELICPDALAPDAPCLMLTGNLVFTASQLRNLLKQSVKPEAEVVSLQAAGDEGSISVGPLERLVGTTEMPPGRAITSSVSQYLPFALNGKPEDANEAELRLAKSLRFESVETDGILARLIDRRVSWRLSRRLAQLGASPNGVTIFNTFLGFVCAVLFASTSYWARIAGSLLFLVAVTLDGVDGEVARLRMAESRAGALLDRITDNIVHVAIFIGLMVGCYRVSGSSMYFYLLGVLLIGFALCAVSVERALSVRGDDAQRWLAKVERISGRDFAYLLVILAAINRLALFCWGTAFGTWVFALTLWWLTDRRSETDTPQARPENNAAAVEEV